MKDNHWSFRDSQRIHHSDENQVICPKIVPYRYLFTPNYEMAPETLCISGINILLIKQLSSKSSIVHELAQDENEQDSNNDSIVFNHKW